MLNFQMSPSALDSNAIGASLNDDVGVPGRSPTERGSTCEDGPINVVQVIFIICTHHDLFTNLIFAILYFYNISFTVE